MKRLFSTAILFIAFVAATYAQQSFKLYRLTTPAYAEAFVKAIGAEVKLTGEQSEEIREFFLQTQKHQDELFQRTENTEGTRYDAFMNRQQGHIEGNLRNILGEENYKQYEAAKAKIEAKMRAVSAGTRN